MSGAARAYLGGFVRGLELPPELMVSEWGNKYFVLTRAAAAEPGPFRWERGPFIREVMDRLSPYDPIQRVVFMAGRQVFKTTLGQVWLCYVIDHDPSSIALVEPTVDMLKKIRAQKLDPVLRAVPTVAAKLGKEKSRDAKQTILMLEFEGGILFCGGANSSASLRSISAQRVYGDELDTWKDEDGDALSIIEESMSTFANRKMLLTGNPTIRDASRIEHEYRRGDQRRYFVPCQRCGHMDFITWQGYGDHVTRSDPGHHRITFARDDKGKVADAWMTCGREKCGGRTDEYEKTAMLAAGEWIATAEGDGLTTSYQISSLYAPYGMRSWRECAVKFLAAGKDPVKVRAFVNEVLGETYQGDLEKVDPAHLLARLERYAAEVPHHVGLLSAGVDTQGNRLEVAVWGWGADEESWLISWQAIMGDPAKPEVWAELDKFLMQEFTHESGRKMRIECACVDSGGHHAEQVYRFCAPRVERRFGDQVQRVFAVKGGHERGIPVVGKPSVNNKYHAPFFILCVDTAKGALAARLRMPKPGPEDTRAGYVHLPDWFDNDLAEQLTAEVAIFKFTGGKRVRHWVEKHAGAPNEQLDMAVYAMAALHILGPPAIKGLAERAAFWSSNPPESSPPAPPASAGMQLPPQFLNPARPRGWVVGGWRR